MYPAEITLPPERICPSPTTLYHGLCDTAEWRWTTFAKFLRTIYKDQLDTFLQEVKIDTDVVTVLIKQDYIRGQWFGAQSGLIVFPQTTTFYSYILSVSDTNVIFAREMCPAAFETVIFELEVAKRNIRS